MKLKIRLIWRKAMTDFNGVVAEYVPSGASAGGGSPALTRQPKGERDERYTEGR